MKKVNVKALQKKQKSEWVKLAKQKKVPKDMIQKVKARMDEQINSKAKGQ